MARSVSKRTTTPSRGRANAPSTRSLGPAQERPDPGLEILFRWLARQPRRTPDEQVALARAYQSARADLWKALLERSPDALTLIEDEAERAGLTVPDDHEGRRSALVDFARKGLPGTCPGDVGFRWSRDHRAEAPREHAAAEAARKRLCESNMRLVVLVAKRYRAPADPLVTLAATLPFADLIQEGTSGLLRACDLFDPDLGWRFSTYGCWWIRHGINRALAEQSRTVRIPAHVADQIGKVSRAEGAFLAAHGRLPTDDELAAALQVSARRATLARHATAASRVLPLDPPGDEDGDASGGADADSDSHGADEGTGRGASGSAAWHEVEAALLRQASGGEADEADEAERVARDLTADALDALAPRAASDAAVLVRLTPAKAARPAPATTPPRAPPSVGRQVDRARMRAAVELRWGLAGGVPLRYEDIATALGVGREQARGLCAAGEDFCRRWVADARDDA